MSQRPNYLHIDSRSRVSGSSHSYKLDINPAIEKVKSLELVALAIPQTNHIITSFNNQIYFSDGVTSFIASITPGVYSANTLATEIATEMTGTAYAGTISVTYDSANFRYTISGTINFLFEWGSFTTNSAHEVLGFPRTDTSLSASHTSPQVTNLGLPPVMLIQLTGLYSHSVVTTSNKHGSFIVYCNAISGYMTFHFANTNFLSLISESLSNINSLQVDLIDAYTGNPIELFSEWQFTLKLNY
jgi:phage baseplate assembly protein gpV